MSSECFYCHGSGVRKRPIGIIESVFTFGIINALEANDPNMENCPYCKGTGKKKQ